jgi:DNA sulfur modification protein DndE
MKPPVETIRLGKQAKDQLMKIKRNTGIENWNIICRWALCVSLRETTPPPFVKSSTEDGVEMTWKVFSGEFADLYAALIGLPPAIGGGKGKSNETTNLIHAHIHRGLGYLASGNDTRTIEAFLTKWLRHDVSVETPSDDAT